MGFRDKFKHLGSGSKNAAKTLPSRPSVSGQGNQVSTASSALQTLNLASNSQLKPLQSLQSDSLWEAAYQRLQIDAENKALLDEYDNILAKELGKPDLTVQAINKLQSQDRNDQIKGLVEVKVGELEQKKWRDRLDATLQTVEKSVMAMKGIIDNAASASPHVALAWAGVSILLPFMLNPKSESSSRKDGLESVTDIILRYTVVERVYKSYLQTPSTNSTSTRIDDMEFRTSMTDLYSRILLFEIQLSCKLSQHSMKSWIRDAIKWDNIDDILKKIGEKDKACQLFLGPLDQEKLSDLLSEQTKLIDQYAAAHLQELRLMNSGITGLREDQKQREQEKRYRELTKEEEECHRALMPSGIDYRHQKDQNPKRVPGTCLWALEHPNYIHWRDGDKRLIWISAHAGCGKSVLSRCIIDEDLPSSPAHAGSTVLYFFFKDTSDEQRSTTRALLSLLHQLIDKNRTLIKYVLPLYKRQNIAAASFSTLWPIFISAIKDPDAGRVICLLDALDECNEIGRQELIESLQTFCSNEGKSPLCNARFLITSRPYLDLRAAFGRITRNSVGIELDGATESDRIKQEIDQVIRYQVEMLAQDIGFTTVVGSFLEEALLKMENRTYLWLHLVLKSIRAISPTTVTQMEKFIRTLPKGIEEAYESILDKCPDPNSTRKVLAIVLAAYRPLSVTEVDIALNISETTRSYKSLDLEDPNLLQRTLPGRCGFILSIVDSKVYFIHQTVKEFLLPEAGAQSNTSSTNGKSCKWRGAFTNDSCHHQMAIACMQMILLPEFRGLDAQQALLLPPDRQEAKPDGSLIFSSYAVVYWADHYRDGKTTSDIAKRLINENRMVENKYNYLQGNTIQLAAAGRHNHIFNLVFSLVSDLNQSTYGTYGTLIQAAAWGGNPNIVQTLLTHGVDVNAQGGYYGSALQAAAQEGHYDIVQTLLTHGADVNAQGGGYGNALQAAAQGGHHDIVQMLVTRGADVNAQGGEYYNALYAAAQEGHHDIVQTLLTHGADVNAQGGSYGNAVQAAAQGGHYDIVEMLLTHGADVNAKGGGYGNVLQAAAQGGHYDIVEMLLTHGADVNAQGGFYGNAVQAAAQGGHYDIFQALLTRGTDVNAQGGYYGNALQAAAQVHHDIVQKLLTHGADVNAQGGYYGSALQAAAQGGHYDIVQTLLTHGADVNAQGGYYGNALGAASYLEPGLSKDNIIKLLREHGASDPNSDSNN